MGAGGGAGGFPKCCAVCGSEGLPSEKFCTTCGAQMPVDPVVESGAPTPPGGSSPQTMGPAAIPDAFAQPGGSGGGPSATVPPPIMPVPPKKSHRIGLVLAVIAGVLLVTGAAVGATLLATGKSANNSNSSSSSGAGTVPANAGTKSYSSFQAEYAALKNSVAEITTVGCDGTSYVGTGFVIDSHHIVTAGHVVEGSQSMTTTVNGQPVPTQIIGLDVSGDVALLSSDSALPGPYLPLERQDPQVGERVAAIGFPLAGSLTMTQGSVSAVNQNISVNNTNLAGLVQTDTALNPGNSGGPLIALDGHANGIVDALNTQANATGYAIGPQYAASEVNHWIASPDNHPLPLCSVPNPYGAASGNSVGSSVPPNTEASAASALNSILQQSASARTTVVGATQAVQNCSGDPSSEAQVMDGAISSRESALQQVSALVPTDLPDGTTMLSDLSTALQSSDQADQDFVSWMGDVEGTSCPYATTSDSNFQAASNASSQADAAKQAFLALWNPLAAQLNLTQYTAGQI